MIVYLSTVFVQRGGSLDFRGMPRTFFGPAIPVAELSVINPIISLFTNPFLDSLPTNFRVWLGEKVHWSFQKITPIISSSPQERNQVEQGNIITVGSQYYNSAADLLTETCNPILKMEPMGQGMVIRVTRGPREEDTFRQREGQVDDLAIVEKAWDRVNNRCVFFAAGLGVVGTTGAVHFIINNWQNLNKDFSSKPFALCLRFQNILTDPDSYKKPIELSRFQLD